jgi:hypothetical protein
MNVQKEADLTARLLAAASVLANAYNLDVPEGLRMTTGDRHECELQRLEATALFLEQMVLETAHPGLSEKMSGYSEILVLNKTNDEDLSAIDGVGKDAVKALRKTLKGKKEVGDGENDSQSQLVQEGGDGGAYGSGEGNI